MATDQNLACSAAELSKTVGKYCLSAVVSDGI